jgi:hypothetical protein
MLLIGFAGLGFEPTSAARCVIIKPLGIACRQSFFVRAAFAILCTQGSRNGTLPSTRHFAIDRFRLGEQRSVRNAIGRCRLDAQQPLQPDH